MGGVLRGTVQRRTLYGRLERRRLTGRLDGRVINVGPAKYMTLEKLTVTPGSHLGQLRELVTVVAGVPVHVDWYQWNGATWKRLVEEP